MPKRTKIAPPSGLRGEALRAVCLNPWSTSAEIAERVRPGEPRQQVYNVLSDLFFMGLVVRARVVGSSSYRFASPFEPIPDCLRPRRRIGPEEFDHVTPVVDNRDLRLQLLFPEDHRRNCIKKNAAIGPVGCRGATETYFETGADMTVKSNKSFDLDRYAKEMAVLERTLKRAAEAPDVENFEYKVAALKQLADVLQGQTGAALEEIAHDMERYQQWLSE